MLFSILSGSGTLQSKLITLGLVLVAVIVSLSFHEWAHAFAAHKMGDDTAKNLGRMTINPAAHIDPVGFLMLFVIGFGWAKPVPVNSRNYRKFKLGEFVVSFAGIFTNIILALTAALIYVALDFCAYKGLFTPPTLLYSFVLYLGFINCSLAVFNFIPVYPLDGFHIFELLFGRLLGPNVMGWLHKYGGMLLYGLLILSVLISNTTGFSLISTITNWMFNRFVGLFSWIFGLFA